MLEIKNLHVSIEGKEILHNINIVIDIGETHVLFGPNGSGKTTLLMTIMGFPKYKITKGSIHFNGKDITKYTIDGRALAGIGISFQHPPVVRGVTARDMVKICMRERFDEQTAGVLAGKTNMDDLMERDINYGFSGGEVKRSELMQLLAQRPQLTLLDEPESGVDLVNIAVIGNLINELLGKDTNIRNRRSMGLIITHTGFILDYINARTGYVMCNGQIGCTGDPREILKDIKSRGYQECFRCLM